MNENFDANADALFTPNVEIKEATSKNADEYQPSADKGSNGVYQAIIRLIPWWQDPTHGSIQEKWTSWLVDPITQRGRLIDCPSSIGKPSPLQDMYWKLKKSDNVSMQTKADVFSRRHSFASLIQVIKDKQNPELDGKILVYRYGVKLWEKINAELKPLIGEKHDPFDLINGKPFGLVITKVSGYNNYDQSKFISDHPIPLCIPKDGKLIPITEKSDKKEVFEWVKEKSPDLSKYAYQEWNQEIHEYVNHVISAVTGQSTVSQNYAGVINDDAAPGITSQELNITDLQSDITTDLPNLDLPDLGSSEKGIQGDLDDVLKNL
jgi:hypothetical protein